MAKVVCWNLNLVFTIAVISRLFMSRKSMIPLSPLNVNGSQK